MNNNPYQSPLVHGAGESPWFRPLRLLNVVLRWAIGIFGGCLVLWGSLLTVAAVFASMTTTPWPAALGTLALGLLLVAVGTILAVRL